MKHRLTRIYTRTGDRGTTSLADGSTAAKTDPRIEALGAVDELNSALGVLRAQALAAEPDGDLQQVQQDLFDLGGQLALPGETVLGAQAVARLEQRIDRWNAELPPLTEFVLPGGANGAAECHLARAICRRAERRLLAAADPAADAAAAAALRYLNRLSDLLFVLARVLARANGAAEPLWRGRA